MEGHSIAVNPNPPASPRGGEGQAGVGEPLLSPPQSVESPPPDYPTPFVAHLSSNYSPEFSTLNIPEESRDAQVLGNSGAGPPKFDDLEPPPYNAVVKLPTYEEAQQGKMVGDQQHEPHSHSQHFHHPLGPPNGHDSRNGGFNFMTFNHPAGDSPYDTNTAELALGTDVYFFASFLIAFLFNWIGFLLLMCACHTVAGRYGALAGFGLSLAKWTLIVKHSTDLASNDNNWLWWLIMAFGVLICVRAVIQYLCIKREWHRLSRAAQERVVFFY